jgi:hypothetical protein
MQQLCSYKTSTVISRLLFIWNLALWNLVVLFRNWHEGDIIRTPLLRQSDGLNTRNFEHFTVQVYTKCNCRATRLELNAPSVDTIHIPVQEA